MSLFSRRQRPTLPPPGSGYSLLDSQLTVTGDISTAGSLRIDGRVEGSILKADAVVLGVGATMTGDVHARDVVIGGALIGNVVAAERVELQATAIVTGDIVSQIVLIQEGGVANGRVVMKPPTTVTSSGRAPDASLAKIEEGMTIGPK